jgi:hypothetical protein
VGGEDDELAVLLAAWREDIDSVPAPAMLMLEAALTFHADVLALSAVPRHSHRIGAKSLHRPCSGGRRCPRTTRPPRRR